jgi:hypothetical protein
MSRQLNLLEKSRAGYALLWQVIYGGEGHLWGMKLRRMQNRAQAISPFSRSSMDIYDIYGRGRAAPLALCKPNETTAPVSAGPR